MADDRFEAMSAGTAPTELDALAARVMEESGINISEQFAKSTENFFGQTFQYVIAICSKAIERCPIFPGAIWRLYWDIEDPAPAEGDEAERMIVFRRVRETLKGQIEQLISRIE